MHFHNVVVEACIVDDMTKCHFDHETNDDWEDLSFFRGLTSIKIPVNLSKWHPLQGINSASTRHQLGINSASLRPHFPVLPDVIRVATRAQAQMKPNNAHRSHTNEAHYCRKRLDRPIVHQGDEINRNPSIENQLAGDDDHKDEYAALLNLEARWAGGEEAKAIRNAEYSRLDPVAPSSQGEKGLIEAAVDHRGAEKVLDACVNVAEKVW